MWKEERAFLGGKRTKIVIQPSMVWVYIKTFLGTKTKSYYLYFFFFFEVLKCQYIRIQEPIYGVPPPPSVLQKTAHIHTIYAKNAFPIFSKMQRNFAAEFDLFLQHGFIEHNFQDLQLFQHTFVRQKSSNIKHDTQKTRP